MRASNGPWSDWLAAERRNPDKDHPRIELEQFSMVSERASAVAIVPTFLTLRSSALRL